MAKKKSSRKKAKKKVAKHKKPLSPKRQSLLDMTSNEARAFLLKSESYFNNDLPDYMQFGGILSEVAKLLRKKSLSELQKESPRSYEHVNYAMLSNKDGRHAWRPLQLINPVLYVSLVSEITEPEHWTMIQKRFAEFATINTIKCLSIPVKSLSKQKDKAEQVSQWWQGIEQRSVELALDYQYVLHADITDCYAAIYTHSIAWALHGRDVAKKHRQDDSMIGNVIDGDIRSMRYGQTNGIPQGSVLMDLIAEMVLGYADLQLNKRLKEEKITKYQILRYRDDYRIFVNNPQHGEAILKTLTEVMIALGLKLNAAKTTNSQSVISGSIKADKRAWMTRKLYDPNLQKHLLVIHAHGMEFPNAGSLNTALLRFRDRLTHRKSISNPISLISIAVDIAYQSPRVFPVCAAIISKLLNVLESDDSRLSVIQKIHARLLLLPNTGHMEVWLQRISHPYDPGVSFQEPLCRLVCDKNVPVWNNNWISSTELKTALNPKNIIDREKLKSLKPIVQREEISLFSY